MHVSIQFPVPPEDVDKRAFNIAYGQLSTALGPLHLPISSTGMLGVHDHLVSVCDQLGNFCFFKCIVCIISLYCSVSAVLLVDGSATEDTVFRHESLHFYPHSLCASLFSKPATKPPMAFRFVRNNFFVTATPAIISPSGGPNFLASPPVRGWLHRSSATEGSP